MAKKTKSPATETPAAAAPAEITEEAIRAKMIESAQQMDRKTAIAVLEAQRDRDAALAAAAEEAGDE